MNYFYLVKSSFFGNQIVAEGEFKSELKAINHFREISGIPLNANGYYKDESENRSYSVAIRYLSYSY